MSNLKESDMINSCAKKINKIVKICQQLGRGLRLKKCIQKKRLELCKTFQGPKIAIFMVEIMTAKSEKQTLECDRE